MGDVCVSDSVLLKHHFGRLDHDLNFVAYFERHFLGAFTGDYTFDEVLSDAYHNMRHYAAELKLLDGSCKLITGRKCHPESLMH